MNRRNFLKFTTLSAPVFLPLSLLPEQQTIPKKQQEYTNHLGIMVWSSELVWEVFGKNPPTRTPKEVERVFIEKGFPGDIKVLRVYRETKDVPFGTIRFLISQKDLPIVYPGSEIPTVVADFSWNSIGKFAKFEGWI